VETLLPLSFIGIIYGVINAKKRQQRSTREDKAVTEDWIREFSLLSKEVAEADKRLAHFNSKYNKMKRDCDHTFSGGEDALVSNGNFTSCCRICGSFIWGIPKGEGAYDVMKRERDEAVARAKKAEAELARLSINSKPYKVPSVSVEMEEQNENSE